MRHTAAAGFHVAANDCFAPDHAIERASASATEGSRDPAFPRECMVTSAIVSSVAWRATPVSPWQWSLHGRHGDCSRELRSRRWRGRGPPRALLPRPGEPQPTPLLRARSGEEAKCPAVGESRVSRLRRRVASQNCCKYAAGCCQSDGVGSLKSCQTMKEAYAVRRTVPPSAEIQAEIDKLLVAGWSMTRRRCSSELARLGARLIIQRAVEDEFDTWLGRARYERRPERQRGLRNYDSGLRNGFRPRHVQTGEGELRIEVPQARGGGGAVRVEAVPEVALQAAAPDGPAEGAGDRRVRPRPVDARRRVAVRGGRAREDLTLDGRPDLRGAARALRSVLSPLALRHPPGRAVPRRDLPPRPAERPEGRRGLRLGNHRRRRESSWFPCAWGRASPRRTGSSSAAI